jgi:hypothetical protein
MKSFSLIDIALTMQFMCFFVLPPPPPPKKKEPKAKPKGTIQASTCFKSWLSHNAKLKAPLDLLLTAFGWKNIAKTWKNFSAF